MKKVIRRLLMLTLVLMVMLAVTGTAMAASVTWTTSSGATNRATVSKTSDWYYVYKPIEDATIARHVKGTEDLLTWPTGDNASYSVSFPSDLLVYRSYLLMALTQEGLQLSVTSNTPGYDYYVIPEDIPTGTYSYGTEVKVYDTEWIVALNVMTELAGTYLLPTDGILTAELAGVPASCTNVKLIPVSE